MNTTVLPPVPLYEGITGDRAAFWAGLRQRYGEAAPVLLEPGVPAWLLLSYAANRRVMADDTTFKRDPRHWHDLHNGVIGPASGLRAIWRKRQSALFSDGDEHAFLSRGLISALSALDTHRVTARISAVADELIAAFAARGSVDLIADYARLLPLHVLCSLFAMTHPQVRALTAHMQILWHGGAEAATAAAAIERLLMDVAVRARTTPGTRDLPALLAQHGHTDVQIRDQLLLVIAATDDPVTHTIGATLRMLLCDAELSQAHARSRYLISETVNHVLMRATPLETMVGRYPVTDVRIGDHTIGAGECLVFGYAAASSDLLRGLAPTAAATTRAHLTFGTGAHRCPRHGRDLALTMAEVATTRITDRFPDLAAATDPATHTWIPTANLRGLDALPARFTPTPAPLQEESLWKLDPYRNRRPSPSTPPGPASSATPPATSTPRAPSRGWRFPAAWWSRR